MLIKFPAKSQMKGDHSLIRVLKVQCVELMIVYL